MYVIRIGDGLFVKRVQIIPRGLRLLSDNEFYKPIDTTEEDIAIVGRAYVGLCLKRL